MRLKGKAFANTSAVFTGVVYLVCGLLVAVVPEFMMSVARSWFHGINLDQSWSGRAFPGNFLYGLVTSVVGAWLAGWFFAWLYNRLVK